MEWHRVVKGDPRKVEKKERVAVQSFARGLALLRVFGSGRAALTSAEAAAAAGLTRAGARRLLLMTLQQLGYASYDGKRYALTPRVLELGFTWLSAQPLFGVGEPVAKRLAERLNETVSIGVLDLPDVVYVVRALSSRALHLRLDPGARIPAHTSSMGLILLGALEPVQLAAFLTQWPRRRYTERTPFEEADIRGRIAAARRDGFCYLSGVMDDGIAGLSVPLRGRAGGRPIAALNLSTSLQRTSPEVAMARLLPELRAAASAIEAALPG